MNFQYTLCLIALLFPILLSGQQEVPISQNDVIKRYRASQELLLPKAHRYDARINNLEKRACAVEDEDISYVLSGNTVEIDVNVNPLESDTTGAELQCDNCDDLMFGTATLNAAGDLIYVSNGGIDGAKEFIAVSNCNMLGCNTVEYPVVIRRPSTSYAIPSVALNAEGIHVETLDETLLPGELICNTFIECVDNYQGREQKAYFSNYNRPDNTVIYRASRFGGTDQVCVLLCDEFAVCDTFKLSFEIASQSISLPFMDDFSYDGPTSDPGLWLDSETYINDQMGIRPPSIGVATFDGVDERGRPYGGEFGQADRLTSAYIDLSNEPDEVFLTYWVQKKGRGNLPEAQDSFVVQLKNDAGEWKTVRNLEGGGGNNNDFVFYKEAISDQYKHATSQFRFVNYSNRTGILDHWHLDYVRVSDKASETDTTFADIAFTKRPDFLLTDYTSMPLIHFQESGGDNLSQNLNVGLYNHAIETLNADPSNVQLTEINSNVEPFNEVPTLFNGTEANIPAGVPEERTYSLSGDPTGFPDVFGDYFQIMTENSFSGFERLEFVLEYNLSNNTQINQTGFESVQRNDRVERRTIFDNYFAYDDGTAESGVVASFRDQIAVEFTASASGDSLRAVQFHFPHTTIDVSDQLLHVQVWIGELDDEPEYEAFFQSPSYADVFFDTLQGFTTYPLVDDEGNFAPIELPVGKFYVGWEQASGCEDTQCIPVGYDKNNPGANQFIYRNFGFGWEALPNALDGGALMIRPVVGSTTPGFTDVEEDIKAASIKLFPNPSTGLVYVGLETANYDDYQYQLFNNVGQLVQEGVLNPQIELFDQAAGIYYLKIANLHNNQVLNRKLILIKN